MTDELKTFKQWQRAGRTIIKGSEAQFYLVDDDRVSGRGLFRRDQTEPMGRPEDADNWTTVIPVDEWEQLKAERKAVNRGPRVKIRKLEPSGAAVWCGPDREIINLLRYHKYTFNPATRYWDNPNKDPEQVARGFESGKIRDQRIRVTRDWEVAALAEGVVI